MHSTDDLVMCLGDYNGHVILMVLMGFMECMA